MMSLRSWDVVIVGGGVVGLSATLAMHQRGFSVALMDGGALAVDANTISPRVYAINQASQHLLQRLNVWPHLDGNRVSPYREMLVWDGTTQASIAFDSRLIATDRLGSIIDESNLRQALLATIAQHDIHVFPKHKITAIEQKNDGMSWTDDQHQNGCATWMIIADGTLSPSRQLLEIPIITWPYHQDALVVSVTVERPHQSTAFQVFLPQGTLAFLPLNHPNQCSIVWSMPKSEVDTLISLPEQAFNERIARALTHRLGQVSMTGVRYRFPLHMRHTRCYAGKRWLLMGDAAHTIHPLAGLGLNLGLADLSAWLTLLDKAKSPAITASMLATYQRQRKHEIWKMIAAMEGLKLLFVNPCSPVTALRSMGLTLFNRSYAIKRWLIVQAAGGNEAL